MDVKWNLIDLDKILKEIYQMFDIIVSQKNVKLIFDIKNDKNIYFKLDEFKIREIIINLISNAANFTEKGYIKVSKEIKFLDDSFCDLEIIIKDTGIGIGEEDRVKIFEAYEQQSNQDLYKYRGTGLGLSICKKLVNLMSGDILLESEKGVGSTFKIVFKNIEYKNFTKRKFVEMESNEEIHSSKTYIKCINNEYNFLNEITSNSIYLDEVLNSILPNAKKAKKIFRKSILEELIIDLEKLSNNMENKNINKFINDLEVATNQFDFDEVKCKLDYLLDIEHQKEF